MPVPTRNNSRQIERLTRCPICLENFRLPKVLPCMHTFCLTPCLSNLVDPRDRRLRCPECHQEHLIPAGGVQSFPSTQIISAPTDMPLASSTITMVASQSLPDRCFICNGQRQTLIQCQECSRLLCTNCRPAHLQQIYSNLNSSVNRLRNALPQLNGTSYEQQINDMKTDYEQIRRNIMSAIGSLIDELKFREMALLTEAEAYMQSQLRSFRVPQENSNIDLRNVAKFCETVGRINPNERLINEIDMVNMKAQCDYYLQQIQGTQVQMPVNNVEKLQLSFDNRAALSSSIQNFGRLSNASQRQPSQHSSIQNRRNSRNQLQHNQYRDLEDVYNSNGIIPSQTLPYRSTRNQASTNINQPFGDMSSTVPARANRSSYPASQDVQPSRQTTSSSLFGPNPFATNNSQSNQRRTVSQTRFDQSANQNFGTSTNAARSIEGDNRPIFGGGARVGGGGGAAPRGRAQTHHASMVEEQLSPFDAPQRQRTFVLNEPTFVDLPQSGAQKPRDSVNVQDLYNVRRRKRAKTPVAFTVDLIEGAQSNTTDAGDDGDE